MRMFSNNLCDVGKAFGISYRGAAKLVDDQHIILTWLHSPQRLVQVGDQVVGIFNANRQPY